METYHKHLEKFKEAVGSYKNWQEQTTEIRKKHFVPFHFQPFIERYILIGVIEAPHLNHYLEMSFEPQRKMEAVSKLYIYGVPSQREMDYITRNIDPIRMLTGKSRTNTKYQHPLDNNSLKTFEDENLTGYANILQILHQEHEENITRTDYQRAMILYGETKNPDKQEKLTTKFRTMKSRVMAKQRELFSSTS